MSKKKSEINIIQLTIHSSPIHYNPDILIPDISTGRLTVLHSDFLFAW